MRTYKTLEKLENGPIAVTAAALDLPMLPTPTGSSSGAYAKCSLFQVNVNLAQVCNYISAIHSRSPFGDHHRVSPSLCSSHHTSNALHLPHVNYQYVIAPVNNAKRRHLIGPDQPSQCVVSTTFCGENHPHGPARAASSLGSALKRLSTSCVVAEVHLRAQDASGKRIENASALTRTN
eukprot:6016133-Pleurochrysis_carterae.AAC.3